MPSARTAIALLAALLVASAVEAQSTGLTVGQLMLERQRELMTPSAAFCATELPDQAADFQQANERFKQVAVEATQGLRDRFGASALSMPAPASALDFDPARLIAERGRVQGSEVFCPQLLQTMRTVTVEALRDAAESAFARMEAIAAARKRGSGAPN